MHMHQLHKLAFVASSCQKRSQLLWGVAKLFSVKTTLVLVQYSLLFCLLLAALTRRGPSFLHLSVFVQGVLLIARSGLCRMGMMQLQA